MSIQITEMKPVVPHWTVVGTEGTLLGTITKVSGEWQFMSRNQLMNYEELVAILNQIDELKRNEE